jgi:hypothetical protein
MELSQESIASCITEKPATIHIFGATPRYSAFEKYMRTLTENYADLSARYAKNKRLKGIDGNIKNSICALAQNPGLEVLKNKLDTLSLKEQIQLFLTTGIEQKTLKTNIQLLLNTAHKNKSASHLVHIFMPSYFADAQALNKKPECAKTLITFLEESANFYKKLYQEVDHRDINIHILIPKLEHFTNMIEKANTISKLEANTLVLQEELTSLGRDHNFVLLDQDIQELEPMIITLRQQGVQQITGTGIPITNAAGFPSTIFHPYILKQDKNYPAATSPIFNNTLVEYVQKQHTDTNHE